MPMRGATTTVPDLSNWGRTGGDANNHGPAVTIHGKVKIDRQLVAMGASGATAQQQVEMVKRVLTTRLAPSRLAQDKKASAGSSQGLISGSSSSASLCGTDKAALERDASLLLERPPMGKECIEIALDDGSLCYLEVKDENSEASFSSSTARNFAASRRQGGNGVAGLLPIPMSALLKEVELLSAKDRERKMKEEMTRKDRDAAMASMVSVHRPLGSGSGSSSSIRSGAALWVDKYAPKNFPDLLSPETINRSVLKWIKMWDSRVFTQARAKAQQQALQAANGGNNSTSDQQQQLSGHKRPYSATTSTGGGGGGAMASFFSHQNAAAAKAAGGGAAATRAAGSTPGGEFF
jgi:hypothetical protein